MSLIEIPTIIAAAGNSPKRITEHVERDGRTRLLPRHKRPCYHQIPESSATRKLSGNAVLGPANRPAFSSGLDCRSRFGRVDRLRSHMSRPLALTLELAASQSHAANKIPSSSEPLAACIFARPHYHGVVSNAPLRSHIA